MTRLIFLICSLLFLGCQTVVDIDIPVSARKLVINSINNPDSTWRATITLSRHILDESPFIVPTNAFVTVIDPINNAVVDQLQFSSTSGAYLGLFKPEVDKEYMLRVIVPGYETVEAVGSIPVQVPITKIEIDSSSVYNDPSGLSSVKIHFSDPPSKKNFYKLSFESHHYWVYNQDTIWNSYDVYFEVDDPTLKSNFTNGNLFVADTFFEGKNHTLSVKIPHYFNSGNTQSLSVKLLSLSEDYFRYATTLNLQQSTSGDPFSQPVQVYTNIRNGLGIFGGYNQYVQKLN